MQPQPNDIFEPDSLAARTVDRLRDLFEGDGSVESRTTKSQVAFRRARGFAFVWRPGQWNVSGPEAVLSIALPQRIRSDRFREVVHPSPGTWMHHLGLVEVEDIDAEVIDWLRLAAEAAG